MYESTKIAERIKLTAKSQNIVIKDMLFKCGLSKNALSSMASGGSTPKSENLAKIADYLDCSVDYLLGRTDNPNVNGNNVSNIETTIGTQVTGTGNIVNHYPQQNEIEKELCSILSKLNLRDRTELLTIIYNFVDEHKK